MTAPRSATPPIDVCMISSLHPPLDKRVYEKELLSMREAGLHVVHVAPNLDGLDCDPEHCVLYEPGKNRVINSWRMLQTVRRLGPVRSLHANELDSCLFALPLASKRRIGMVLDLHEDYAGEIELRFPRVARPLVRVAVNLVQRMLTTFSSHTVLAKQSLFAALPWLNAETATVVANYGSIGAYTEPAQPVPGRFHLAHAGLMSRARCWPQMLDLLEAPGLEQATLEFVGIINDPDPDEIVREVTARGLERRVVFTGWVAREQMLARLRKADVGLLFLETGNTNHDRALPHKVFDYMAAGLPIIVPQHCEELVPIVEDHHCGVVVDIDDQRSINSAVLGLAGSAEVRQEMGRRGIAAVDAYYNWQSQVAGLLRAHAVPPATESRVS